MEPTPSPTRALIDLAALRHNLAQLRRPLLPHQRVLAVIKADAYGHGAVPVARALAAAGVEHFGVARVDEGCQLRQAGLSGTLLLFGGTFPGQEEALIQHRLTPTLFDLDGAERLNARAAALGVRLDCHLKIDTGMSRVGFLPQDLPGVAQRLAELSHLSLSGVYSHLALADSPGHAVTEQQILRFRAALGLLHELGLRPREIHLSNSAGILTSPLAECTLVRPGISLYGSPPSPEMATAYDLRPVMNLVTGIARLQQLPAGTGVSYGHHFVTRRPTLLASLPVGYADGFRRGLTNQVQVLVRGVRVPVVGTICMDWALADVTDVSEVAVGDRVTLLGCDGGQCIRAEDWAERLGTIAYEIYCGIGPRVPRILLEPQP